MLRMNITYSFSSTTKLIKFLPVSESKFYDTLYSLETEPISKTQELLHNVFDNLNKKNSIKKRKINSKK